MQNTEAELESSVVTIANEIGGVGEKQILGACP